MIDVVFWTDKFKKQKSDLEFVKNMIKEAKI